MTNPTRDTPRILLAHGGGGRLSAQLIRDQILPRFGHGPLAPLPDAASLHLDTPDILFTTDSFVVQPPLFPGGNIGDLAVYGTVNDLAVAGGRPRWLSLALVLEEGLPLATLQTVLDSVRDAAARCAVLIATGDTKVVPRGQCDGLYINTAGIGERLPELTLDRRRIEADDAVLVSGNIGDHGLAVLAAREGIGIAGSPLSDTAPVHRLVDVARRFGPAVRFMRDPTRGGVAAVLNEIAGGQAFGVTIEEAALPVSPGTRALAEMLGLDILGVPCEGRVLMVCSATGATAVLDAWRTLPEGRGAARIGTVTRDAARVCLQTLAGGRRLIAVPQGELLPRIC
ncbi:MAG: Hydrogenase isoenzymes formation protein HypE [Lentisphaerae bacterium ADurb.BinA184]|nr:MAG: Hydrogenase isoenzymes formation protein HypE [Lentisphaerae bacterium ADurb.BinA184]